MLVAAEVHMLIACNARVRSIISSSPINGRCSSSKMQLYEMFKNACNTNVSKVLVQQQHHHHNGLPASGIFTVVEQKA